MIKFDKKFFRKENRIKRVIGLLREHGLHPILVVYEESVFENLPAQYVFSGVKCEPKSGAVRGEIVIWTEPGVTGSNCIFNIYSNDPITYF